MPDVGEGSKVSAPAERVAVWVLEWQLSEYRDEIQVGALVTWDVVASDQEWMTRLLGPTEDVPFTLDAYRSATAPLFKVSGRVVSIRAVMPLYARSEDSDRNLDRLPAPGFTRMAPVVSTAQLDLLSAPERVSSFVVTIATSDTAQL